MDSRQEFLSSAAKNYRIVFFILLLVVLSSVCFLMSFKKESRHTFLYFGYGSNMLTERIHIHNPTAKFVTFGTVQNYRFGFEKILALPEDFGAVATIRRGAPSDQVMGVVWEIDADQMGNLDAQELYYEAIDVDVTLENGTVARCRTYEMISPTHPSDFKPHPFYKKICVEGAKQHKLPMEYIQFLQTFEDTKMPRKEGFYEPLVPVIEKLERQDL